MEELRQRKQQYLRQKILDQNYDAQQFMEFCQNTKGSIDIDSWTFNELVDMVRQFIAQQQKQKNQGSSEFTSFYSSPQNNNNNNKEIKNQVTDKFNNWSEFYSPPQPTYQKKVDLNTVDLDFLMGFTSPRVQSPKKNESLNQPYSQSNYMIVPGDVAKKLQQGNQSFVVGYQNPNQNKITYPNNANNTSYVSFDSKSYQNNNDFNKKEEQKKIDQSPQKTKIKNVLSSAPRDTQTFECQIQTRKISSKTRLNGNQQAVVSGHEIINPNVFVPNYVQYAITINPLNVQVKRRMKDFQTFRTLLKKLFPTVQIPHLQRYGRLSQTQPAVIKKQKLFLQSFVNNLLINQNIRCKFLQDFLLCQDAGTLKKIFKQYQKFEKPKSIETTFTHQGKAKLKYNQNNRKYIQQQTAYLDYLQSNLNRLKGLYDQVIGCLAQTTKLLTDITEVFDGLKQNTKTVNSSFPEQFKLPELEKTFQCVSTLNKQWGQAFKTQAKILQSEVRHLCRYQYDNAQTMKEILKIHQNIVFDGYCRRTQKSDSYKQSYDSKKLIDYKSSIEGPSKNMTVLKYQAGYIQQQAASQIKRYLKQISYKFNHKFNLFSMLQLNINNDLDGSWKDFQKSVKYY